jgi:hypothetical protein
MHFLEDNDPTELLMHTVGNKPETYAATVDGQALGSVGADDKHPSMCLHASVRVPHIACVATRLRLYLDVITSKC